MAVISIVTGTLNRRSLLPAVIENTVSEKQVELVLVDGGSTDGTIEYVKNINHPRIRLVEIGCRSSYPHYMNEGIRAATGEWIVAWNDDVLLRGYWWRVIARLRQIKTGIMLFSWWNLKTMRWTIYFDPPREVVLNYGAVHRSTFERVGLYNNAFKYYCADGEFAYRAWKLGTIIVPAWDIRVEQLLSEKRAIYYQEDVDLYHSLLTEMKHGKIPEVEKL